MTRKVTWTVRHRDGPGCLEGQELDPIGPVVLHVYVRHRSGGLLDNYGGLEFGELGTEAAVDAGAKNKAVAG